MGIIGARLSAIFVDAESGPVCELDTVYRPLSVLMATTLGTIRSEESLLAAAQRMREKRIGSLLTIEAGEIVGIVTESDLVRKGLVCKLDSASTRVQCRHEFSSHRYRYGSVRFAMRVRSWPNKECATWT